MITTFSSQDPNFVDFTTWLVREIDQAIAAHDQPRFAKTFAVKESRKGQPGLGEVSPISDGSYTVTDSTATSTVEFEEMMAEWIAFYNVTVEQTA